MCKHAIRKPTPAALAARCSQSLPPSPHPSGDSQPTTLTCPLPPSSLKTSPAHPLLPKVSHDSQCGRKPSPPLLLLERATSPHTHPCQAQGHGDQCDKHRGIQPVFLEHRESRCLPVGCLMTHPESESFLFPRFWCAHLSDRNRRERGEKKLLFLITRERVVPVHTLGTAPTPRVTPAAGVTWGHTHPGAPVTGTPASRAHFVGVMPRGPGSVPVRVCVCGCVRARP